MNWNRPLGYGVKFDEVQLHRAGTYAFAAGDRFYSHPANNLYSPPLLKLHGSINWFVYSGISKYPFGNDVAAGKEGQNIALQGLLVVQRAPDLNGNIIEPIVITPVVHKQVSQSPIIPTIWKKAG